MKVKVYPLRSRGRRLNWVDVHNNPGATGELLMATMSDARNGSYRVLKLLSNRAINEKALPTLYEPKLENISNDGVMISGLERCSGDLGSFTVLQEWHVVFPENF